MSDTTTTAHVDRDLVTVTGPEALAYLHSQVSQSLDDLAIGESRWSFVLQPQGKSDGLFRVTRVGDDALVLDCDAGHGEAISASIARFKLRTKAEFEVSSSTVVEVRGPGARELVDAVDPHALAVVDAPWSGAGEAVDVIGPVDSAALPATIDAAEALAGRIRHGMPRLGIDVDEAIPNETGLIDLTVSFTKGCYRGQELVERIHARGGNRRLLQRLVTDAELTLAVGATVVSGEREVGEITSSTPGAALAHVRGDVDPGEALTVDGTPVTAELLFSQP